MAAHRVDKSKPYILVAGGSTDGFSNEKEASMSCFCGGVQLAFPVVKPGLVGCTICHCSDCRKLTASMFSSILAARKTHVRIIRGEDLLRTFATPRETVKRGSTMTNRFCGTCGTLLWRESSAFPKVLLLRLGNVDDHNLVDRLTPQVEQFIENRVDWLPGATGIPQAHGMDFFERPTRAKL